MIDGMSLLLGTRGLNPDRGRLLITSTAVAFAIVLMIVQLGLLAGFAKVISGPLDHARADLWIVPQGTDAFDDASHLAMSARYAALRNAQVASVMPVAVGFAAWRSAKGAPSTVIVIGSDPADGPLPPWNLVAGSARALGEPDAVAVDTSYGAALDIARTGDTASIEGRRVRAVALTSGIRSFTTSPYVFTSFDRARRIMGLRSDQATYLAVRVQPGATLGQVQKTLATRLPRLEVLTPAAFRHRNIARWLLETGAGAALLIGATLGLGIGGFIVTQTIHASIRDNRKQLATLRAMGATGRFLMVSILSQVALTMGLASLGAVAIAGAVTWIGADGTLPIALSPGLVAGLLGLVVAMCLAAAMFAYIRVSRLAPAVVLNQ